MCGARSQGDYRLARQHRRISGAETVRLMDGRGMTKLQPQYYAGRCDCPQHLNSEPILAFH